MPLLDLDDLESLCRSGNSRAYIKEALDCYRAGAFRSCVIATWIALVYDVIDKLRELALTGDTAAAKRVHEFDEIQRKRDTDAALKFEREILAIMQHEFQLVTAQEFSDLSRLLEDRNRCGHPNLNRDSDAYTPPPELARLHLRVVVEHVLQRPPVQGKSALEHLQKAVDSEYFPTEIVEAEKVLQSTALPRLKHKIIAEFVLGALSSVVREPLTAKNAKQRVTAASVARRLHPDHVLPALKDKFDGIIARTDDAYLANGIWLLTFDSDLQQFLKEPTWAKLESFIRDFTITRYNRTLPRAITIDRIHDAAVKRLDTLSAADLALIVRHAPSIPVDAELIEKCISTYRESTSFDSANSRARDIILPLLPLMNPDQLLRVVQTGLNGEVKHSFEFRRVLREVKDLKLVPSEQFKHGLEAAGLLPEYQFLVEPPPSTTEESVPELGESKGADDVPF